jgi:hypothetical protein
LAWTAEALAAEYNPGLVKRAERELLAGQVPELTLAAGDTLVGSFPDGVVVRLPAGVALPQASCSCGATSICRHRLAVVLRYRAVTAAAVQPAAAPAPAPATKPGEVDDDTLRRELGAALVAAAHAARAGGLLVAVQRPTQPAQPLVVRLPTCTVTFYPPGSLPAARCDCADPGRCLHLVLAVWAVREANHRAAAGAPTSGGGLLGGFELSGAVRAAPRAPELLAALESLGASILERGAAHAGSRFSERFARLRTQAEEARLTWIVDLLAELERLLERYAARNARYHEAQLLRFLVELAARARAARQPGELPPSFILGTGEAAETLLERVRLVSLGARLDADGELRRAEVYLADPAAGTVGVVRQSWSFPAGTTAESGPALAQRTILPRLDLGTLAHGNLVSRAVRRRASGELVLGTAAAHTTLLPGSADFSCLPAALLVRSVRELREREQAAPPPCLRPRLLTAGLIVFAVAEVESVSYAAAEQTVQAMVRDAEGELLGISLAHRAVAPNAIEAFAAAFARGVRFVSGQVHWDGDEVWLEAIAVATQAAFIVLDLAPPTACEPLPTCRLVRRDSPLAAAARLLAEAAHHGLARLPGDFTPRLQQAAQGCAEAGLLKLAAKLRQLALSRTAAAWVDAALYWELLCN